MVKKTKKHCTQCGKEGLSNDEVGLNKKLLPVKVNKTRMLCMDCLSAYLDVPIDELEFLVEKFKEEGCELFS